MSDGGMKHRPVGSFLNMAGRAVFGNFASQGIGAVGNVISTMLTNRQNRQLQYEQWHREDTAVQRRAADLQAAGINPLLAAGQAATSSQPMGMKAPEVEAPQLDLSMIESALRMNDDFKNSAVQRELINSQISEHNARTENILANTKHIGKQDALIDAQIGHYGWQNRNLEQAYDFNRLMNPERLRQIQSEIRLNGQQETLNGLREEQARLDISQTAIDNIRKIYENQHAREIHQRRLTQMDLEIAATTLANELEKHGIDVHKWLGTAPGQSNWASATAIISEGMKRLLNFFILDPINHGYNLLKGIGR